MEQEAKRDGSALPAANGARERELTALVCELVHELHPQRASIIEVSPSSRLERDLGIDSLGRTELILRIERSFGVRLPAEAAGAAETVGGLLRALEQAQPGRTASAEPAAAEPLPIVPAAVEARTLVEVLEWHAARHPGRHHLTVLDVSSGPLALTYGELAKAAREVAQGLIELDVVPGTGSP